MTKNTIDFDNMGFDFGVKPKIILVGDMSFTEYFQEASCVALSYAFDRDPTLVDAIPLNLYFMFEQESPAEKFFESLIRWIESSGNDSEAVNMKFFEDEDGGYTLAISEEVDRFMKKMIPKHLTDRVTPLMMLQTQYKKIDTLGRNYTLFKTNYMKSAKISIGYGIIDRGGLTKYSKRFFPKKEFSFSTNSVVNFDIVTQTYNATLDPDFNSKSRPFPCETVEEIKNRREKEIKLLLPLTYHKLHNMWLKDLQSHFENKYDRYLVIQAICNILLFERLKRNDEWMLSLLDTSDSYSIQILDFLLKTHESFDSYYPEDNFFTTQGIEKQIKLDAMELEKYFKENKK